MRSDAAWSLLDPRPHFIYYPKYDAHIVYWNGIAMTKAYALMIYSSYWLKSYSTRSQKLAAAREYKKIYLAGGFGHQNWDQIIEEKLPYGMVNYLVKEICRNSPKFLIDLVDRYTAAEALNWFMTHREHIDKTEKIAYNISVNNDIGVNDEEDLLRKSGTTV